MRARSSCGDDVISRRMRSVLFNGHHHWMADWPTVAITAAATLTSAGLTGAISLALMRRQDRSRGRSDLAAALQAHGYAADKLGVEIAQLPPPPARVARASQALVERLPMLNWSMSQVARHTLARPAMRSVDTYMAAMNRLMLVAPREVLEPLERLNELLTRIEGRHAEWHIDWDVEWRADWNAARGALMHAARAAIGTEGQS